MTPRRLRVNVAAITAVALALTYVAGHQIVQDGTVIVLLLAGWWLGWQGTGVRGALRPPPRTRGVAADGGTAATPTKSWRGAKGKPDVAAA